MFAPALIALAREAMATRFELALHGANPVSLRAAGEEALEEISRLDRQLNLYNPASELAQVNARAAREPVRVSSQLFRLLDQARQLHAETGGAFDITVAPLLRCWGFMGGKGRVPSATELAKARACTGMGLVELEPKTRTVRFTRAGVMLDLGAIGKGYAIEQATEMLREAGVTSALLHGGTSTVCAIGHPPDASGWRVAIEYPSEEKQEERHSQTRIGARSTAKSKQSTAPSMVVAVVSLKDEALSVSAVWGKSFRADGKTYGHVLDPRTGRPASTASLAAIVLPSATETDAFSTALLTVGVRSHDKIARLRPGMRTLVMAGRGRGNSFNWQSNGIDVREEILS